MIDIFSRHRKKGETLDLYHILLAHNLHVVTSQSGNIRNHSSVAVSVLQRYHHNPSSLTKTEHPKRCSIRTSMTLSVTNGFD